MRILDKKFLGNKYLLILEDGKNIEIDKDVYIEKELYICEQITEDELNVVLSESILKCAKKTLVQYITKYPHRSEFMYYEYLLKKGYDSATAKKAVAYFVELGYIDEMEAAIKIVKRYEKIKTKLQIKNILLRNGFKTSTISRLDLDLKDDDFILEKLIQKKIKLIKKGDRNEIMKVINWLVSKGFDYNRVIEKIREFLNY